MLTTAKGIIRFSTHLDRRSSGSVGSGSGTVVDTTNAAITGVGVTSTCALLTQVGGVRLGILEMQAQTLQVNVAVTPDQESTEAGLGQHVENTLCR